MINSRIGANYLQYPSAGTGFVLNKSLFIVGNLIAFFCRSDIIAWISLVIMCVPLVKKGIVNILEKHRVCESLLIFSAVILLTASDDIKSALLLLVAYHVFDGLIFYLHLRLTQRCFENSAVFENPIGYRTDSDGNYIISNNEYTPAEGKVVCGTALADDYLVSRNEEAFPVQSGDNLAFSCKIVSGSIVYKPYRKTDKSVYNALKNCFLSVVSNETETVFTKFLNIFRLVQTVAFIVISALELYFNVLNGFSFLTVSLALLGASPLVLTCFKACRVNFLSKLCTFGIYQLKDAVTSDFKILDLKKLFESGDISKYDIFTYELSDYDAKSIVDKLLNRLSLKRILLNIVFILNTVAFAAACLIVSPLPMILSTVLSAIVSAIIVIF